MTIRALAATLAAGTCIVALTAPAQAQPRSFDIAAGTLRAALDVYGRQAGRPIIYRSEEISGVRSPGFRGTASDDAALDAILAGTGFSARSGESGSVAIVRSGAPPGEGQAGGAAADSGSADGQSILVVGTNIRGIRNRTAPVTILDRAYIDSTGYSTAVRLLESLPQNFALSNQSVVSTFNGVTSDRSQGEGVNLRAIGEGTTLVLLNGRRMALAFDGTAVDISMLPLSAVDRVEVLTDGASALYGADAVGGVVNFALRRDFRGFETRLRAGWAPGGINEYRLSQTAGTAWGTGSALLSGEFYHRDLLPTSERDFVPANTQIASLLPRDRNISLLASGHQELGMAVELFGDLLYANRDSFNRGGRFTSIFAEDADNEIDQITAYGGLTWRVTPAWRLELTGGYGRYDRHSLRGGLVGAPRSTSDGLFETHSTELKADGSLFELPGGAVRAAIGGSYRWESFDLINNQSGVVTNRIDESQRIASLFGEINIPFFSSANAVPGLRRLELSLAARYDHYSNFGSSFDPRIGLAWEPIAGLLLRGSYGTSYVAPKLSDYDTSNVSAAALFSIDPAAPGGVSYQLQVAGGADVASLGPQESRSFTAGAELTPPAVPGLRLALGYYDIRYDGQIAAPPIPSVLLANPAAFGSLFIRNPTVAQVQDYVAVGEAGQGFFPFDAFFQFDPNFNPASVQLIIDARRRNLAEVRTRGIDFSASYDLDVGSSALHFGLDGVYILERIQRVTATSQPFDTVDTLFNPTDLRLRGSVGWRRGGLSLNAFVNHIDSYTDNRVAPFIPVDSWTTVDVNLAYRFEAVRGPLAGVTVALSAANLFNQDPPSVVNRNAFEIGFDPSNANPLGRLVAIEISKRW